MLVAQSVARRALLSATAPLRPIRAHARHLRAAGRVLAEHGDGEAPRTKSLATRLVHPVSTTKDPYGGSSPPLYQTATFAFEDGGEYDYTRSGNPTRTQLESVMADLEGATRSFAFTSGMGALAVAMRLVPSGGHIVTGDDIYGGTSRLLSRVAPEQGISVSNVDMCDLDAVRAAMRPETKLVWLESPTNPRMQVTDVAGVAAIARQHGALSIVDNSIMAPVRSSRPILLLWLYLLWLY